MRVGHRHRRFLPALPQLASELCAMLLFEAVHQARLSSDSLLPIPERPTKRTFDSPTAGVHAVPSQSSRATLRHHRAELQRWQPSSPVDTPLECCSLWPVGSSAFHGTHARGRTLTPSEADRPPFRRRVSSPGASVFARPSSPRYRGCRWGLRHRLPTLQRIVYGLFFPGELPATWIVAL